MVNNNNRKRLTSGSVLANNGPTFDGSEATSATVVKKTNASTINKRPIKPPSKLHLDMIKQQQLLNHDNNDDEEQQESITPPNQSIPPMKPLQPVKYNTYSPIHEWSKQQVFMSGFNPYVYGWTCHFAKKAHYKIVPIPECGLYMCRNASVAIFDMCPILREELGRLVYKWCSFFTKEKTPRQQILNPFWGRNDMCEPVHTGTVFIRLSSTPAYFVKKHDTNTSEQVTKDKLPVGVRFNGGVVIIIKGIKINEDESLIAPMVVVSQVQHIQQHDIVEKNEICILDNYGKKASSILDEVLDLDHIEDQMVINKLGDINDDTCLLYTSPSPRDS